MSRPRSIAGNDGSRIKVILGPTGDDFVLTLDEDNGETEWQSYDWDGDSYFSKSLCIQINNIRNKSRHVVQMALGLQDEWYVFGEKRNGNGGHGWWGGVDTDCTEMLRSGTANDFQVALGCNFSWVNIKGDNGYQTFGVPNSLSNRMSRINKKNGLIKRVRLLPSTDAYALSPNYWISDSDGQEWSESLDEHFGNQLQSGGRDEVSDVVQAGDMSWIVIRPNRFVASTGVSARLTSRLEQFYRDQKARREQTNLRIKNYDARIVREQQEREEEAAEAQAELQRVAERLAASERAEQERFAEVRRRAEDRRRAEEERKQKRKEMEETALTLRRTNEVQEAIHNKRLRVGTTVNAVGDTSGVGLSVASACVITRIRKDGVDIRLQHGGGTTFFIQDPRQLVVMNEKGDYDMDRSTTLSMLCLAHDKYEASLCFLECECHNGVCRCRVVAAAKISIDPSPRAIRPLLENRTDGRIVSRFDEYTCAEKIDFVRLKRVLSELRMDHNVREECIKDLDKEISISRDGARNLELLDWLKALQRCQVIQAIAETLEEFLRETPPDKMGCVVHEVRYEHRDSASRGRLFAIGAKVKVLGEKHVRTATLQGMPSDLRSPLVGAFSHDIDCENSEVRLVCSLASQLGLEQLVPTLIDYRDRRHYWLVRICTLHDVVRDEAKRLPNIILSGGMYDTWLRKVGQRAAQKREVKDFARRLWSEIRALRDQLLAHPRFSWTDIERKNLLAQGRQPGLIDNLLMPRIVASCENEVLGIIHRCLFDLGWHIRAKVFDGLIIEPSEVNSSISEALKASEDACLVQGWSIKLIEKILHGTHDDILPALDVSRKAMQALNKRPSPRPYLLTKLDSNICSEVSSSSLRMVDPFQNARKPIPPSPKCGYSDGQYCAFYPNLCSTSLVTIAGQTIYATNDVGVGGSPQPYSMIDASFAATLAELQEGNRLTRLVDPSPLIVCTCKGDIMNVAGMLPPSKPISIIMAPNSDAPNSNRVKVTLKNVLVVHNLPVPIHLGMKSSQDFTDVWNNLSFSMSSTSTRPAKDLFPVQFHNHKYWSSTSVFVYLGK